MRVSAPLCVVKMCVCILYVCEDVSAFLCVRMSALVFMRMCACTLCVCKDVRTFVCCVKMCVSASCVCVHASKSVFAPYVGVRIVHLHVVWV